MNLSELLPLADGWKTLEQVQETLGRGIGVSLLEGVPAPAKGWLLANVARKQNKPLLVVTYNDAERERLADDLRLFLPDGDKPGVVRELPSSLPLLLDDEESTRDVGRAGKRLNALVALANGEAPSVLVATAPALLQLVPPPATLKTRRLVITTGETLSLDVASARLNAFGYVRSDLVSLPGTFARRGDILDIFPSDGDQPVRIDLFGDEIETIRYFDVDSQRSEGKVDQVTIVPAHELVFTRATMAAAAEEMKKRFQARIKEMERKKEIPERLDRLRESAEADIARIGQAAYFAGIERYLPLLHPDATCALDFLPDNTLFVLDEPAQVRSHFERDMEQVTQNLAGRVERGEIIPTPDPVCMDFDQGMKRAQNNRPTLVLSLLARTLPWLKADTQLAAEGANTEGFQGRPGPFTESLSTYSKNNVRVVVVSAQVPRVRGLMAEKNLTESPLSHLLAGKSPTGQGGITLVNGVLKAGFKFTDARLVVISDAEIFGSAKDAARNKRRREFREGMRITSLLDLKDGDYVVHINHGIGQYQGLTKMTVHGIEREYLLIQYEGSDRLYVPVDQVDRVQKYIGNEGAAPPLNKLGGQEWAKATAKAKRQVAEIAQDLIRLYAARQATEGYSYHEDTPWQREMEDAFPYVETPDQDQAIKDVKRDLEAPRPMDRLICGDVGFGKTEVAMRAAFKVAIEGRQVAVLCPTTVLCAQHFQSFKERMEPFGVNVDMMSRFRSPKEQAETLAKIKDGTVNVVVGTHRLLSKDLEWKDLGLVVVDEEQRFGVTHKERLKQIRQSVDVLSMSATPIPRTLQMSLSGIRDMSLINDPPEGRSPVKTLIKEYDEGIIREAILRETDRGGQVYFIHNRIESIYHVAARLEKLVPTARFRIAHGQMNEEELEEVMVAFYQKEFDVLVCTTIVESGLDIPNVNTIIIDNADKFGLSQLYQLRGRVGRSKVQAYAILLYQRHKVLSTVAEQRLGAVREFSDLGSGYKIALRDLEIRGAGNLLGAAQSGTVATVGLDLYMQLLESTIRELKHEEPDKQDTPLPTVELPVPATIPDTYVPGEPQRILMYKKLAAVRTREDVSRLQEEMEDRFGDPPQPVWNALSLLRLRLRCQEVGIEQITTEGQTILIRFKKGVKLPQHALRPLTAAFKGQNHIFTQEQVTLKINSSKILNDVENMVEVLHKALTEPAPPPTKKAVTSRDRERRPVPGRK